jgi:hypothetical protein
MAKRGKRYGKAIANVDREKRYALEEAATMVAASSSA